MNLKKYNAYVYAPIVLRIGIAIVFLWFGLHQLINPESFLVYIPQWLYSLDVNFIIVVNGFFETVLGVFLILGLFTRVTALLLSLHLFGIIFGLGYNDIAVRDFGLALATISIVLHGADKWCLDCKFKKKELAKNRNI